MKNQEVVVIKVGPILKELLAEKNISLRDLSKASGVAYSTLQEWSGNRSPKNPIQVIKVAAHLGVSMHFLLFGIEDKEEPIQKILKEDFFSGTFEITVQRVKLKDK